MGVAEWVGVGDGVGVLVAPRVAVRIEVGVAVGSEVADATRVKVGDSVAEGGVVGIGLAARPVSGKGVAISSATGAVQATNTSMSRLSQQERMAHLHVKGVAFILPQGIALCLSFV